jgi:hypothetical protein
MRACFQELLKRLQEKHGKYAEDLTNKAAADAQTGAGVHAPNVLEVMILFQQDQHRAKAAQDHAKASEDQVKVANKVTLDGEGQRCCLSFQTVFLKKRRKVLNPEPRKVRGSSSEKLVSGPSHFVVKMKRVPKRLVPP